ncbi:MAG: carboxypeptidase-like regulatory domain-containing protein [Planctomycetaceae bacterium]
MTGTNRKRRSKRSLGLLLLLLLLCALLPLSRFLAGVLPGGGRRQSVPAAGTAPRPGTLRVVVVRADSGEPVEGAIVEVEGLGGGEGRARSDPRGEARLEGLGGGAVRVEASAAGRAAARWVDPRADESLLLAVEAAPRRTGRVRGPAGAPVRAIVRLLDVTGEILSESTTDADGRYDMEDHPRAVSICAFAKEGAPSSAREGDLFLEPGAQVRGRLVGAGGALLRIIVPISCPGRDEPVLGVVDWTTDPDGSFQGELAAGARAYALFEGLPVRLGPGEIALPRRVEARGRVLGPGGAPARGASLLFRPLLGEDFPVPLPGLRVVAGEDGSFAASGFCDGDYAVEVRAPGCAATHVPRVVPGEGPIEIELEAGFRLAGRVVDPAALPIEGAEVIAMGLPDDQGRFLPISVLTGRDGLFTLDGIGGRSARVRVQARGFHPMTLDGLSATGNLRLLLQRR